MNTKIRFTYIGENGLTITHEFDGDLIFPELVENFRSFSKAIGYQERTITENLGEEE